MTLVDPQAGLPADTEAAAFAEAVEAVEILDPVDAVTPDDDDRDVISPEEAALHIERESDI